MVWDFRRESQTYFPIPDRTTCLEFAFTEIAEALDAELRRKTKFRRNTPKEHSVETELTQCAFMLLSSVEVCVLQTARVTAIPTPTTELCRRVAKTLSPKYTKNLIALYIVANIQTRVDLFETLPKEFDRIRRKFGPKV